MEPESNYLDTQIVKDAMEYGRVHIAYHTDAVYEAAVQKAFTQPSSGRQVQSPAEAVFLVAFIALCLFDKRFDLEPQVEIQAGGGQKYRFDFVVRHHMAGKAPERLPLAVEIDGHAFHEKTRDQVTYRNRRDRDVQTAGYRVFHFSFSELVGAPTECASEVWLAADEIIRDFAEQEAGIS